MGLFLSVRTIAGVFVSGGRLHESDRVIREACDEKLSAAIELLKLFNVSNNNDNDDHHLAHVPVSMSVCLSVCLSVRVCSQCSVLN